MPTKRELELITKYLEASLDNLDDGDFWIPKDWTPEEEAKLYRDWEAFNGRRFNPEVDELYDYDIVSLLIRKLKTQLNIK